MRMAPSVGGYTPDEHGQGATFSWSLAVRKYYQFGADFKRRLTPQHAHGRSSPISRCHLEGVDAILHWRIRVAYRDDSLRAQPGNGGRLLSSEPRQSRQELLRSSRWPSKESSSYFLGPFGRVHDRDVTPSLLLAETVAKPMGINVASRP